MTRYAEALEKQLFLGRWMDGDNGARFREVYVDKLFERVPPGERAPRVADAARHWWALTRNSLATGDTFFWSAPLCALAIGAAARFPTIRLAPEDLPCDRGFMWFEQPIPMPPATSGADTISNDIHALSWVGGYLLDPEAPDGGEFYVVDGEGGPGAHLRRVYFVFWTPLKPGHAPVPLAFGPWAIGEALDHAALGIERRPSPIWAARWRFVGACFALVRQRILTASPARLDRASRRRLAAAGVAHEPAVRVVELRRRTVSHPAHDARPIGWTCRWLVRGHWRQQPCGSGRADHRPTWIAPHLKGPESKPLKSPRATVFAVVR